MSIINTTDKLVEMSGESSSDPVFFGLPEVEAGKRLAIPFASAVIVICQKGIRRSDGD